MMISQLKIDHLLNTDETMARELFLGREYPWEVLPLIAEFVPKLGQTLSAEKYDVLKGNIFIAKSAKIAETATVIGPCIIGENTEVRPGAFIRGNVIVGKDCVVGNSTELKNVILFNNVQVPHYNYVGDSVLGYKSHLGAGAITSNIKSDRTDVTIRLTDGTVQTNLRKMGAIIGDYVEIGCNTVCNPGSVIGRNTTIYPLSFVRGYVRENSIYKRLGEVAEKEK